MKNIFLKLSIILLGLSTGAMLLIGIGIAPYWSSITPIEFMQLFADSSPYMGKLMVPLGLSTAAITLIATAIAYKQKSPNIYWMFIACFAAIISALSFPLYFKEANAVLQSMMLSTTEASEMLVSWQIWHWARIVSSTIALYAALQFIDGRPHKV